MDSMIWLRDSTIFLVGNVALNLCERLESARGVDGKHGNSRLACSTHSL
jgi:hypothetical protein